MATEKEFVSGLYAKLRHDRAPDFVFCTLSAKRAELIEWLENKDDEWINMQVLISKKDQSKLYIQVDNWKPDPEKNKYTAPKHTEDDARSVETLDEYPDDINPDDITF